MSTADTTKQTAAAAEGLNLHVVVRFLNKRWINFVAGQRQVDDSQIAIGGRRAAMSR